MSDKSNFETVRTLHFRSQELSDADKRTISDIETYGCAVVHVKSTKRSLNWSYTIGICDTCEQPEIIQVGLKTETAHALLNNAAEELRKGVELAQGRHRELLGEVECEFRPVDPKWIKHLMGWAVWYYGGTDFPVLQAVYPDLENRFPEDDGFNEYFRQPMLQPDVKWTRVEEDFWASADPKSSLFDWKFADDPHTGAYVSKAVDTDTEAINFVSHDLDDGAWQFLGDSMSDSGGVLVCLHHPIDKDPSLVELADLPLGWYAERDKPGEPWIRRQREPEEADENSSSPSQE